MRIGVIGLGLLGRAISRRLVAGGVEVFGYDLKAAACEEAALAGVEVLPTASAVAEAASTVVLSLLNTGDRRALLWGEQRVAAALRPKALLLDTTTAAPQAVVEDHERLAALRVRLVDVCVSGSSQAVREHRALTLVGDTAEGAAAYADILRMFSARQYYFGAPGRGNEAKLVVNTVFGLHRLVLAEALALARAAGFDLEQMLDVLKQGETYSAAMDTKGPKMVTRAYEPAVARLAQHAKDVRLILEYAETLGADVPLSRLHDELIVRAIQRGAGPLDNAAIFEAYPSFQRPAR